MEFIQFHYVLLITYRFDKRKNQCNKNRNLPFVKG